MSDTTDYDALAARAEAGELHSIAGTAKHGDAAADAGRNALMLATGTGSIEDATRVALGRPRLDAEPRNKALYWKVRPTQNLDILAKSFVKQNDVNVTNVSELVRRSVIEYVQNHSNTGAH